MARKSRRNKNDPQASVQEPVIINKKENLMATGAYARLSVENETDDTIKTQVAIDDCSPDDGETEHSCVLSPLFVCGMVFVPIHRIVTNIPNCISGSRIEFFYHSGDA